MTTRSLGAIALVVTGVWAVVLAFGSLPNALWAWQQDSASLGAAGLAASGLLGTAGLILVAVAPKLSRLLFPADPIEHGPPIDEVLPIALAFGGAWLLVENAYYLFRLVLPFLFYGQWEQIAWSDLAYDALAVGLAALLFCRSRAIARLWLRCNRRAVGS